MGQAEDSPDCSRRGTVIVARDKLSRHTSPDLHDSGHALAAYLQTLRKEVLRKKNVLRIRP